MAKVSKLPKLIKMIKLFKLLKIAKSKNKLFKLMMSFLSIKISVERLLYCLVIIIFSLHLFTCIW